jgi:hypothetical protein
MPSDEPKPGIGGEAGGGNEIVVFMVRRETRCGECGEELFGGSFLRVENGKALCLECADLGHLEFLPRGDAALTRRASKHSKLRAVVVQWSRSRKRYERQGVLVEPAALAQAEEECLADAEPRARRQEREAVRRDELDRQYVEAFARAISQQFPGCPAGEARAIAEHACLKHSGRVGRSAAAKELDREAMRLAVVAHIRHVHTDYDEILMREGDRKGARAEVAEKIDELLERWERK